MNGKSLMIGNRKWRVRVCRLVKDDGDCDPPETRKKVIRIASEVVNDPQRYATVLIHEIIHAFDWHRCEDSVEELAESITRGLVLAQLLKDAKDG